MRRTRWVVFRALNERHPHSRLLYHEDAVAPETPEPGTSSQGGGPALGLPADDPPADSTGGPQDAAGH
jgi:hypothetical protein